MTLPTLERDLGVDWIRTHLFPHYKETPVAPRRNRKTQAALTNVKNQLPAATETIELVDLPQRANNVETAVKILVSDAATSTHDVDNLNAEDNGA